MDYRFVVDLAVRSVLLLLCAAFAFGYGLSESRAKRREEEIRKSREDSEWDLSLRREAGREGGGR